MDNINSKGLNFISRYPMYKAHSEFTNYNNRENISQTKGNSTNNTNNQPLLGFNQEHGSKTELQTFLNNKALPYQYTKLIESFPLQLTLLKDQFRKIHSKYSQDFSKIDLSAVIDAVK